MNGTPPLLQHILLIENDAAHARLVIEALNDHAHLRLHTVPDAVQAMHFITRQQGFSAAPTPDLIILDLHLQAFSGKVLLEQRKRWSFCSTVPVVVVTSSGRERLDCMLLGATDYHLKPMDWCGWRLLMRELVARYLAIDLRA